MISGGEREQASRAVQQVWIEPELLLQKSGTNFETTLKENMDKKKRKMNYKRRKK